MFTKIRIADGLQSAERLITTAGAIINRLTGNPSYPLPPVDLKTVQAAVDDRWRDINGKASLFYNQNILKRTSFSAIILTGEPLEVADLNLHSV
jgi:hypothetical protein